MEQCAASDARRRGKPEARAVAAKPARPVASEEMQRRGRGQQAQVSRADEVDDQQRSSAGDVGELDNSTARTARKPIDPSTLQAAARMPRARVTRLHAIRHRARPAVPAGVVRGSRLEEQPRCSRAPGSSPPCMTTVGALVEVAPPLGHSAPRLVAGKPSWRPTFLLSLLSNASSGCLRFAALRVSGCRRAKSASAGPSPAISPS